VSTYYKLVVTVKIGLAIESGAISDDSSPVGGSKNSSHNQVQVKRMFQIDFGHLIIDHL
jgi:hypothetical protein